MRGGGGGGSHSIPARCSKSAEPELQARGRTEEASRPCDDPLSSRLDGAGGQEEDRGEATRGGGLALALPAHRGREASDEAAGACGGTCQASKESGRGQRSAAGRPPFRRWQGGARGDGAPGRARPGLGASEGSRLDSSL